MYVKMKSRPLQPPIKKTHNLQQKLKNILEENFNNNAFSTFPYIRDNMTSKMAIKKTNSGNCISLSMFIKEELKKYGISSHLVPATVPSYIYKEGYLDICHVSLVIPINKSSFYLIDPAFYFMEPVIIHTKKQIDPIKSVNIYDNRIDVVNSTLKTCEKRTQLNQYQILPKGTPYCECYYNENSDDTWNYYLREIVNPDQAISKFFISIRNEPFFVSTKMNGNMCTKDIIIKTYNNGDHVSIKVNDTVLYDGHVGNIPQDIKHQLVNLLQSRNYDSSILSF